MRVQAPHRPPGQLAQAAQIARLYRPIADPSAQAAAIVEVIKPLIAQQLAEVRAPLPEPIVDLSPRDHLIMKACVDVGDAVDRLEAARQTPGERAAWLNLLRATNRLRYVRTAKEADLGSR
jgi:hypothetical protein